MWILSCDLGWGEGSFANSMLQKAEGKKLFYYLLHTLEERELWTSDPRQ
jgi:hypothetical protein